LAILLAALCGAACRAASGSDGQGENPRERLFAGAGAEEALVKAVGGKARLYVLFTPEYRRCTPETTRISRALRKIAKDYPDTRVFTLRPESLGDTASAYGESFPGAMLTIPDAAYEAQAAISPNPRLEVWTGAGERRLLLMRSLPRVVTESEIYDEVLWARSFTGAPAGSGS
jgi:hypothetical protein